MKKLLFTAAVVATSVATFEYFRRKGVVDELAGKAKRKYGELVDDTALKVEGVIVEGKGKVKEFLHDTKEAVEDVVEETD